jgi:hypothetical protein
MFDSKLLFLIIVKFSIINCIDEDIKIHRNSGMSVQMEHHVIAQALTLTENEIDMNIVSKKISDEMNHKFGKNWIVFAGVNTSFSGIDTELNKNPFIWFSLKYLNFIVFKEEQQNLIANPITEARKSDAKIVIIKDEMIEKMKNMALVIVKQAINNFNNTEAIAEHVIKELDKTYGNSWFCFIGYSENGNKLLKNAVNSTLLSFKIESSIITIFQIKGENMNSNNQVKKFYS